MPARRITVSVECCDPDTGEMDITVEDPDNPEPDYRYQDMQLHPMTCHLLHELLGVYVNQGVSTIKSHNLNAADSPEMAAYQEASNELHYLTGD